VPRSRRITLDSLLGRARIGAAARLVRLASLAALLALLLPAGCTDTPEQTGNPRIDLKSSDPHVKVIAAQEAARKRDPSTIPQLIDLLGDEEQWVRYNAHMALNVIVGPKDEFGYNYLDPPKKRAEGIRKYREWYASTQSAKEPK
jgi:hypothetical protein